MTDQRLLGDRYELGEVLGRGGMAEVRRGRDRRLGRIVAVKMLRVDHSTDATFQARFRREAQSAASLNHRNIVAVYDTGEDVLDGHRIPYIVMEHVEGRTLRELLHEQARFTPERSIEIVTGVLDALEYSHKAGIVHRDIKPGNVMITGTGEVKVMDFGIARSLADSGVTLTQTAAVVGTAQYISPEQARGEQADARSDLYATGCVLFEMLTGRPPFVGESLVSVAVSHVREMPTPPSAIDPSIPRDIDAIVMKALAKERLERYQSAFEMRADLERAAAGLPVAAAADTSAATQLMAPATVAYDQYGGTAADLGAVDEDLGEGERRGMSWGRLLLIALAILAVAGIIGFLLFRDDGNTQQVGVPDIVGLELAEAQQRIEDRGLVMGTPVEEETDDPEEVGIVLSQDPAFNELVAPDTTVTPTIGVAPEQVAVPDGLVGSTEEEARAAIDAAGLTVGLVTREESDDAEPGEVLSTDPASGEEVSVGTAVNLVVAQEPDTAVVPSVLGRSVEDARNAIEAAGLEFGNVTREPSDQPVDTVLRTDPEGGTEVEPGSTVSVVISDGPAQVEVPDVRDQDEGAARAALEGLGLQVSAQSEETCDATANTVTDQSPGPGTEVDPGTTVEITVAQEPEDGCG
ncbi:MAG TPA: Stk1 family PASTA domain-containing Ser/Thr kinase [Jiangellaceae bacterium]|jgi:serine/threonine-protein kinase|nr:Stk1 family PASTA domain-containing Ser/Thr kinase [Jiangellaceae bacterium]